MNFITINAIINIISSHQQNNSERYEERINLSRQIIKEQTLLTENEKDIIKNNFLTVIINPVIFIIINNYNYLSIKIKYNNQFKENKFKEFFNKLNKKEIINNLKKILNIFKRKIINKKITQISYSTDNNVLTSEKYIEIYSNENEESNKNTEENKVDESIKDEEEKKRFRSYIIFRFFLCTLCFSIFLYFIYQFIENKNEPKIFWIFFYLIVIFSISLYYPLNSNLNISLKLNANYIFKLGNKVKKIIKK